MNMPFSHSLTLDRVEFKLNSSMATSEQQTLRRQTIRALEQVSIHPAIPPAAILIVRRLPDAKPGQLLANGQAGLSDQAAHRRRTWEQATQHALTGCWQTAYRPMAETVPSTANSVRFIDTAEWLACLSLDLDEGIAGDHWWWTVPLRPYRQQSRETVLSALWQSQAQWVPTAFKSLCQRHPEKTARLLDRLSPVVLEAVLSAIASTYRFSLSAPFSEVIQTLSPYVPTTAQNLTRQKSESVQVLIALSWTLPAAVQILQTPLTAGIQYDELSTENNQVPLVEDDKREVQNQEKAEQDEKDVPSHTHSDLEILKETDSERTARRPEALPAESLQHIEQATSADIGVRTELGGLWYLVNVLSNLGWPRSSPTLTPWHQLLALSKGLISQRSLSREPYFTQLSDPVWDIFTEQTQPSCPGILLEQWYQKTSRQVLSYLNDRLDEPTEIVSYLRESATLYFTNTHVDIVFSLEQIRMDLRIAGLDQDPGWVPELGRAIAFHYE